MTQQTDAFTYLSQTPGQAPPPGQGYEPVGLSSATLMELYSSTTISTTTTLAAPVSGILVVFIAAGGIPVLPTAVGNLTYYVLKNDSGGSITPQTTSAQLIEGGAPTPITNNTSISVVSDGANWRVV